MEDKRKSLNIVKSDLLIKMCEFPDKKWALKELNDMIRISDRQLRTILNEFRNLQWISTNSNFNDRRSVMICLTELGIRRGVIARWDMQIFGKKSLDEIDNLLFEAIAYIRKRREKSDDYRNKEKKKEKSD